ncbi:MAG: GspH/FimT family pseudopilin [Burkholderiales bacterium]|nr:GspH/FimT family pseudopilin [Burkholderiales bacterium]
MRSATACKRHRSAGFSLIELMVAIGLLGALAALGAPALLTFMDNSRIRASAEAFYATVQQARAEAVRRNTAVDLVLTADAPTEANVDTAGLANDGAGTPNVLVRSRFRPAGATEDTLVFLQGKPIVEGARGGGGATVSVAFTDGTVTFTPLSNTTKTSGVANYTFTLPSGGACVADGGPMRCLRVAISPGGRVQLCDPVVSAEADTRRCPS